MKMTMPKYSFLSLSTIRKWIPLMEARHVSVVARSARGFLSAYALDARGDPRNLSPEWWSKRDGFIARHMAQVIANDEDLFDEDGLPTRRHLALIAWAYSPQPKRL
jgi:hypothetical protein